LCAKVGDLGSSDFFIRRTWPPGFTLKIFFMAQARTQFVLQFDHEVELHIPFGGSEN
jgi:hypothetical protein